MKKAMLAFILLLSAVSYADVNSAICFVKINGNIDLVEVDFTKREYDNLGYKITSLADVNGFNYAVQSKKGIDGLFLTVAIVKPDETYSVIHANYGTTASIQHFVNNVSIACKMN